MKRATTIALALAVVAATGCTSDPRYIDPNDPVEVNAPGTMDTATATTTIDLPIRLEKDKERMERDALAAELGVEVPYVKAKDLHIEIEWSLENLSDQPGEATISLDGATEYAQYVPSNFVIDPQEDPTPPSLMGGIPMMLEPGEVKTGVFREDQIYEASVDLELMYRAAYNPFAAVLEVNKNLTEIIDTNNQSVPKDVFASMVRFDFTLTGTTDIVMNYDIRVRDERGILHDKLLNPDDPGQLTTFSPVEIQPPMMTP